MWGLDRNSNVMDECWTWIQCTQREMTALHSVKSEPFDCDPTVTINNTKINKKI
jgi:hypothetical protein